MTELYVVINSETNEPATGGGSSSPAYIRAFTSPESADRSARGMLSWYEKQNTLVVRKFVMIDDGVN